jgi:hypothetical protein
VRRPAAMCEKPDDTRVCGGHEERKPPQIASRPRTKERTPAAGKFFRHLGALSTRSRFASSIFDRSL